MRKLILHICLFLVISAEAQPVRNQAELDNAIRKATPGSRIVMAKGEWNNTVILFEAKGTPGSPIVIEAEEAGAVKLTGNSSLRFAGDHLEVRGLRFTNGFTQAGPVVEFRKNDQLLANDCRITNCVIEDFSKPDRFTSDSWIVFWGKRNRMDHCTIGDKLNIGTTLIVELNDERSQRNFHRIDSNHFYRRSVLGSNGGEEIRVGVSRYSLTPSNTIIEHNYFEKVNGEVEIISIKSCYNTVSMNTFFECEGGLVLRHGDHNVVTGNLFLGNGKPFTGGIRVINPDQTVTHNLVLNAAGVRFRSALGVLNGVPNSQINRYFQVKNSTISRNSFIDCAAIVFGAGKDNERTAAPENVLFSGNYISVKKGPLYEDLNNDGGMIIKNNGTDAVTAPKGFAKIKTRQVEWNGMQLTYPADTSVGADLAKVGYVDKRKVGAAYFRTEAAAEPAGKTITVKPEQSKQLPAIVAGAGVNDVILLTGGGRYEMDASLKVDKKITIRADTRTELVHVGEKSLPAFIIIENGGSLTVSGISFNSAWQSFGDAQSAIVPAAKNMNRHYQLVVKDCEFYNFNESSYASFKAAKGTFADSLVFENCLFRNMSGAAIDLSAERDDKGIYNAENVIIRNCIFTDMLAGAINIYRGGNDESTTGPFVTIDHCIFNNVENREQGCVVKLLGVQYARITNSIFNHSGQGGRSIWFEEMGWDDIKVDHCNFYEAGRVQSFYGRLMGKNNSKLNPMFVKNDEKLQLPAGSQLKNKASDGGAVGIK
ncbi:chondroitinase-B domain-containing protein [Sediminibacterium ginsengisoli]|uniref:Poly(Beta-D-mannuronate) lyase n=1 Tax=Sediminibacterium ginsengisoli TaxID=413434 RepID=A0A1T4PAA7_9BACT|nr:chondroitinase-B domain-containing protein [Sediminibacterium ginsengisoli]SJZ88267.1 poly(beta-D-mannuronate) lyase [Sediminibacterium ginsengisoli]